MIRLPRSIQYWMALLVPIYFLLPCLGQNATPNKRPLDYANGLVGTAPLDKQNLIGNAPPPGELVYSGFTSPGATLPQSATDMAPINNNLDLTYPSGVGATYYYPNRTMFGFSSGAYNGPTVMPVVGNWTVPPQRSASVYDKARENPPLGITPSIWMTSR